MKRRFRAATVQMNSGADKPHNLTVAEELVQAAADAGADLVVLPELFNCLADPATVVATAESIPGSTSSALADLAARLKIHLLAGSIAEQSDDPERIFNTSLLFGPDGSTLATYRKMHLFGIDLQGEVVLSEPDWIKPGDENTVIETALGRLGLSICYDLRFPELYRQQMNQQADVLVIASAFTMTTGRDHWEVLLRARAIENQTYVVAANQYGRHTPQLNSYGRSMIVDPWGTPLATAADGVGFAVAEIDLDRQARIRQQLPALQNRRLP